MGQQDRRTAILEVLNRRNAASIRELAALVYASEASVRRDVAALEEKGMVRRVYGGVLLSRCENTVVPLAMRDGEHSAQKEKLARQASALVEDGDTILLDASSTVRRMVKYLAGKKNLTIITNNHRIPGELGACDARVYCTGGEYVRENHAFAGPAAEAFVRSIWADKLFFSSQGVTREGEISDFSERETSLRRVMLERAGQKICLVDASKIGRQCVFQLCGREQVDIFVCDCELPWERSGAQPSP